MTNQSNSRMDASEFFIVKDKNEKYMLFHAGKEEARKSEDGATETVTARYCGIVPCMQAPEHEVVERSGMEPSVGPEDTVIGK